MNERRPFPSQPPAVAQARHFAVDALGPLPQETRDRVALLVSELATNCVRHAGTGFHVSVQRGADVVRIEVTDTGAGRPAVHSPEFDEPSGRGLRIVEQLSDAWGVVPASPPPGKTVWFTLSVGSTSKP